MEIIPRQSGVEAPNLHILAYDETNSINSAQEQMFSRLVNHEPEPEPGDAACLLIECAPLPGIYYCCTHKFKLL